MILIIFLETQELTKPYSAQLKLKKDNTYGLLQQMNLKNYFLYSVTELTEKFMSNGDINWANGR